MENPLRTWWKVRKWFRIPKPSIYFGSIISGLPCELPNKWIELHSYDVTWKDKYNKRREERRETKQKNTEKTEKLRAEKEEDKEKLRLEKKADKERLRLEKKADKEKLRLEKKADKERRRQEAKDRR